MSVLIKLRLSLLSPVGERCPVTLKWQTPEGIKTGETVGRFYHLRVSNERDWRVATNVQVYLLRVEEQGPDGRFRSVWSNEVPIKWRNQEIFSLTQTVGPAKDCDLCTVFKNGYLELQPVIKPNNLPSWQSGQHLIILSFQAKATGGVSRIARIQVG